MMQQPVSIVQSLKVSQFRFAPLRHLTSVSNIKIVPTSTTSAAMQITISLPPPPMSWYFGTWKGNTKSVTSPLTPIKPVSNYLHSDPNELQFNEDWIQGNDFLCRSFTESSSFQRTRADSSMIPIDLQTWLKDQTKTLEKLNDDDDEFPG